MTWKHFDNNEYRYLALCWILLYSLYTWVNTASVLGDYARLGIDIAVWKPAVWESTSHLVGLMLIPLLVLVDHQLSDKIKNIKQRIIGLFLFSIVFSLCHVIGMVLLRKISYTLVGETYDFGHWPTELIYEYRKDVIGYAELLIIIYAYRFIISRLRGEAKVILTGEDCPIPLHPQRLLVKKIGKEFIIRVRDIDWIEAAGNYMNLNLDGRIYPLRETMSGLETKLDPKKFTRIHRSYMVNLDRVKQITPLESGDFEMTLNCGKILRLSRRYRDKVKLSLS